MKVRRMRLTIERLRTLILVAGVLLIAALGVFLALGKYRNVFKASDIPKRLGLNIQEEADDFVLSHEGPGHTLYKIRASKQIQLKKGNKVLYQLHGVLIELYGADGSRVDRIAGDEFEYDPEAGVARATGPVEITVMRPGVAPAIAPKATAKEALAAKPGDKALASVAETAERGEIHVRTSGLSFDRNSGEATTSQRVEFDLAQGSGSAVGAAYLPQDGRLVLDHAVELTTVKDSETVKLHASHAEFERGDQVCHLSAAVAVYRQGEARAADANIYFRDDGTADHLDGDKGVTLTTYSGGRLEAPKGTLEFNEHNQPKLGHLEGGVTIDSDREGRKIHGTSPTVEVRFVGAGELHSAHLERGVQITSDETESGAQGQTLQTHRSWVSPVMDLAFRRLAGGKMEPAQIHGIGGVVVTGESRRGSGPAMPSRMVADDVQGAFGPDGAITGMTGTGHASITETTSAGTRQTTSGDRIIAQFGLTPPVEKPGKNRQRPANGTQIQSATVDGNVVLLQEPASKPGVAPAPTLRATGGRAIYENVGEWLHLTVNPHVTDGGLEMAADKIDVSQASGDAFAHGHVKATWMDTGAAAKGRGPNAGQTIATLGAQGPAHAIADEAQLHQATGEATFQGGARLWQQANSINAPIIVLDRTKQILTARGKSAKEPVEVVLVSAAPVSAASGRFPADKSAAPSVIRVRGGDLKYSSAERKAVMHGGTAGSVVAATGDATTISNEVELLLLPPGNHDGKGGAAGQVDRLIAIGHVSVNSQGRRGTGEKLVYTGDTGNYVLTGTAAAPPRIVDPSRGAVTGEALIFNSRDDSVSIEGGGRKTTTVTTAPK